MIATKSRTSGLAKAESKLGPGKAQAGTSPLNRLWQQLATRVQPKLVVSAPGDPFEREADRVAEQVMRMQEPTVQRSSAVRAAGGASCSNCEGKEKTVMRKDAGAGSAAAPSPTRKAPQSSAQPPAKKSKEDCAKFPGGSTDCEVNQTTGIPTGKVIQQIDETNACTKPCVEQHEAVHLEQMKTFCPRLRDCYIAADKGKRPATDCPKMALFGMDEKECAAYKVSVACLEKRLKTAKECQSKENKEYATRKLETSEKCFLAIDCAR
jgi:hypothetical protein